MTDGAEDHEPSYLQKFSRQFSRHDSEFSGVGRQFSRHDSEFSHQIKNLLDDDHKQFNGTKIPDIILTEDDRLLENNQQSNNGGAGKELTHLGAIALFFRDWAPGTLRGGA